MTTDLDRLFARERERTLPPSRVSLDDAVARGRRRRATTHAREGATAVLAGAVVVGGAGWALSGASGLRTVGSASGSGATATAEPAASSSVGETGPTPTSTTATTEATASPVPTDTAKDAIAAPEALKAVSLPDPAPGFGGRRGPDGVSLTTGLGSRPDLPYWTATFLVGSPDATGPQASVIVGDFPLADAVAIPTEGAEPGPTSTGRTVQGHPAYVTTGSDQIVLSFRTSRFTVMVVGGYGATEDMLVTLAESLRNIG
jgi:hypothetical protein